MTTAPDRFLVKTEYGDVLVTVNPGASGFAPDLLALERVTPENSRDIALTVPLRAFAAKMIDIITAAGTNELAGTPRMQEMMTQEKATSELRRIERWAKENL